MEPGRAEEFGLKESKGKLTVTIGGQARSLVLGGATPGGGDRYVKLEPSGELYAVSGELLRSFEQAETRLLERQFHAFEPAAVTSVKVTHGNKTRELLRLEGKVQGWADPKAPTQLDETAGNWMTKLDRLRVQEYREQPPKQVRPQDIVLKVEYFDQSRSLGFLELIRDNSDKDDKGIPAYLARSENTRWYVEVLRSSAKQVDEDLSSLF
jgi:hypothetical protein